MVNDNKKIALNQESEMEQDVQKVMSLIYVREETRKREDGIKKMMIQCLIKQWIPEYSYPGCDRKNVVHNYKSALEFTLGMYPSIRKKVKENHNYYKNIISKSITNSIYYAYHSFMKRKKLLIEFYKINNLSEQNIKQMIMDKAIDFFKFDVSVLSTTLKLYDASSKYKLYIEFKE